MPDRQCNSEDCDCRHCRKCGGHIFDTPGDVCEECQVEVIQAETEQITRNFGGNYEEAAKFYGW